MSEIQKLLNMLDKQNHPEKYVAIHAIDRFYANPSNCVCYSGPLKHDHYVIGFDLPGLTKDEIDIFVIDSGLLISTNPKEGSHLTKKEIKVPFSASFDTKLAKAKIQNGVLELSVPLKPVKGADKILVE